MTVRHFTNICSLHIVVFWGVVCSRSKCIVHGATLMLFILQYTFYHHIGVLQQFGFFLQVFINIGFMPASFHLSLLTVLLAINVVVVSLFLFLGGKNGGEEGLAGLRSPHLPRSVVIIVVQHTIEGLGSPPLPWRPQRLVPMHRIQPSNKVQSSTDTAKTPKATLAWELKGENAKQTSNYIFKCILQIQTI